MFDNTKRKGYVMKKEIISLLEKCLPAICFHKIWAFYIKYNSSYDKYRYQCEYVLSSKRQFICSRKKQRQYFIFRYITPGAGIMGVARSVLMNCEWAEKNNMIPLIDFEWNYFYEKGMLNRDNIWEYIFENKYNITEVCSNEKNVFVGETCIGGRYCNPRIRKLVNGSKDKVFTDFGDGNWREHFKNLNYYSSKWWKLKKDVSERYKTTYARLFHKEMKILGVVLREEFSLDRKDIEGTLLEVHPHCLKVDEIIKLAKEYKEKWNCTHIFVTTYMHDSIELFKEKFGDKVLYTDRKRTKFEDFVYARQVAEKYLRMNDENPEEMFRWYHSDNRQAQIINTYDGKTVIEYVEEIYGLSLCDCLLANQSTGALAACIWNGGVYKELEII